MKTTAPLIFLLIVIELEAKPYGRERYSLDGDENNYSCYNVQCPKGTVGCKRLQTTSKDGSKLITEVECQDEQGTALNTVSKEDPNPFDRATKFTSYSFTGHYENSLNRRISHRNNFPKTYSPFSNDFESDAEYFK